MMVAQGVAVRVQLKGMWAKKMLTMQERMLVRKETMQLTKMLRMELRIMEMVSINNNNIAAQKMMQVTASSSMKMVTVLASNKQNKNALRSIKLSLLGD